MQTPQQPPLMPPEGGMGQGSPNAPAGPLGYGAYAPPGSTATRPLVIMLFRVYAAMMALFLVSYLGLWVLMAPSNPRHELRESGGTFFLVAIGVLCLGLAAAHVVGVFAPFKPWAWTFCLVMICLGLSGCTVVFAVPMLIFWLKPHTKAAFGRF